MPGYILLGLVLSLTTTLPLAWKWALGMRRTAVAVAALSLSTGILMELTVPFDRAVGILVKGGANWLLTLAAAFALLAYRFYRDPERTVPLDPNVIVSPADGEIIYVRKSRDGALPVSTKSGRAYILSELTQTPLHASEATVIGIAMNFLDVHVNRAPIAGRIAMKHHVSGLFGSLRRPEMVFQNERMTTIIERDDLQITVVQIASRLVRQIVSFVHERQEVELGQRIGMIRFGSQVDLVLPARADLEVLAKPGIKVKAGESIVAAYQTQASAGEPVREMANFTEEAELTCVSSASSMVTGLQLTGSRLDDRLEEAGRRSAQPLSPR
jgi:phosphatidylserine decarboxylase